MAATLESCFSDVRSAIADNDLPRVVEAARAGLAAHPREADLARIEVIALIKLERAEQALAALGRARASHALQRGDMCYEAAYCHFLLGAYAEAAAALKTAAGGRTTDLLLAQIAYKCDNFAECIRLYEALIAGTDRADPEQAELQINLAAARAAMAQATGKAQAGCDSAAAASEGGYELQFNVATGLLAAGQIQAAADLLEAAGAHARDTLEKDGWTDEDIRSETGPIEAQRAAALQLLQRTTEAHAVYASLLARASVDRATRAVVRHNAAVLAARAGATGGVSVGSIKHALQVPGGKPGDLSCRQLSLMAFNMATAQCVQQEHGAARRSLRRLGSAYPGYIVGGAGELSAAISLNGGGPRKALNEFSALAHVQSPGNGVRATLSAAQIALALGEPGRAVTALCAWRDRASTVPLTAQADPVAFVRYYFGICQLIASLSSDPAPAADAATHLYLAADSQRAPDPAAAAVLAAIGDCQVYAGDAERAQQCFSGAAKAARDSGIDPRGLPSLFMAAVLVTDNGRAQLTARLLQSYSRRKGVLECIPGLSPRAARYLQPSTSASAGASGPHPRGGAAPMATPDKSKRYRARRRRRLAKAPPKSYEPGRTPDGERWIPLRQRSYYRPRGRGRQNANSGAQGSAAAAGAGLGGTGSARIAGKSSNAAAAVAAASPSPPADSTDSPAVAAASKPRNVKRKGKAKGKGPR
ncbi:Signal recognition particle subunit SRP72 [Coemansia spiralis]|nr:Signal recognition particle subunit SRP72 [Coemansia spiralis]